MDPQVIGLLVFATVFVGVVAIFTRAAAGDAVRQRLQEIADGRSPRETLMAQPVHQRALFPLIKSITDRIARILPPESIAEVRRNLVMAGLRDYEPVSWLFLKWLRVVAVAGGGIYFLGTFSEWKPLIRIVVLVAASGLAYIWPELRIRGAIRARQARIIKELPETLDLLTISVEAGLGLDQALELVTSRRPGPLSEEIRIYLEEMKLGAERINALKAIGSRTGVEDLISFTATIGQALEYGVSIAPVLRIQAEEVRTRRRQRIEEIGMKAPVKMLFPIIFLILPALFVVTAGPGLIRLYVEFIHPTGPTRFEPPPAR